ncbi:MAG: DNA polymerase Y family protein [Hyphomicrobium sp.]|uniref:Y-family DNA polymerase n=1 Tax=Hyphomicrobium sp. TaxID=82 RepID=UPI001324879F|nr:DNA polymerase Y family protein [Hyphomicrobium sp.]KAB2942500.1 MAG: DNA polymerase Y family protein [Hyphomicrobium sp.]MBZ0208466.1 DNA polymerase Y family protein [Hyphomicrobium sp.]
MKRIVSVWLPLWPIERMRRAQPSLVPDDAPLALVETGTHGIRITAVNPYAAGKGARIGQALADARAALPGLLTQPADRRRDRAALLRLARWCGRYGPNRNIDGDDGLWIDITGVAHLYGGEARLLDDLIARLSRFQLTARAGLADTLGAAHALARYAPSPALAREGKAEAQLAKLPVEALRLAPDTVLLLKRLGLNRIGDLYRLPRAALQRRFRSAKGVEAVLTRLDQALGVRAEPCQPLIEPPALYVQRCWPDPLISPERLEAETARLAQELCAHLAARGLGARRLCLSLYRADGSIAEARVGLSSPSWAPEHMTVLIGEKLSALDAGFGVDVMVLAAVQVEKPSGQQGALAPRLKGGARADAAQLVDRLANRLGATRITRLEPRSSHIPERAEAHVAALARAHEHSWPLPCGPARPPLLLAHPEPIGVVAEVPEGPPARFTWRRVEHRIVRAQGPQRVAPEWWDEIAQSGTRDYYRIEDEGGAGYWVFREGLYGREEAAPRWFLHGLFG